MDMSPEPIAFLDSAGPSPDDAGRMSRYAGSATRARASDPRSAASRERDCLASTWEMSNAGERRLFVTEGKGGRQRVVPVSARFFASVGD